MDIYQILRVQWNADKTVLQAKYLRMLDSYQLTATFAEDPEIAEIARIKIKQLLAAGEECGLFRECLESRVTTTSQTDISAIKLALNSSRSDAATLKGSDISGKLDALEESAEKYYLKAVVSLKLDSSFKGCQAAVGELHKAIKLDPNNAAYVGLLDALSEQLREYEQRQRDKAAQQERDRLEEERRSQEAIDEARRRRFWDAAGGWIGGILGLGAVALACCCVWECCSSGCGCC